MPDTLSWNNYYAFGMLQPGRDGNPGDYRYGFNGKEFDPEISGNGNSYDYGFRIYNPRLGKFLSVDPLSSSYPWHAPYQYACNSPIIAIDVNGLKAKIVIHSSYFIKRIIKAYDNGDIEEATRLAFQALIADIDKATSKVLREEMGSSLGTAADVTENDSWHGKLTVVDNNNNLLFEVILPPKKDDGEAYSGMELFFSRHFDPDELNFLTELFDEPDNADEKRNPFNGKGTEDLPRSKKGGFVQCDWCETKDPDNRNIDTNREDIIKKVPYRKTDSIVRTILLREGVEIGDYKYEKYDKSKHKDFMPNTGAGN